MRACSAELEADLEEECTTLARLWRVTRKDGTIIWFTDAVRPIEFDGDTYRSDITFSSSAVYTSLSMAAHQNLTIKVQLDDTGIKESELRARLYDGATGEIMIINYEAPEHGVLNIFKGTFGQITISNQHVAEIELTPVSAALLGYQIGTEIYSPTCRASLGDTRCGIDLDDFKVAFTVTVVDVDFPRTVFEAAEFTQDDEHWTQGFINWLTGDNAGTKSMVKQSVQATNVVSLIGPTGADIQVGDTGEIFPGCDKLVQTCLDKFNNVANFRGEPNVPTQDIIPALPIGGLRA